MKETRFKDTEVGLIPKDWHFESLFRRCAFQNGYAFNSADFQDIGNVVIRISDIQEGKISLDSCARVLHSVPNNFLVKIGDVLIAMSGATTGKVGIYSADDVAYINQRVGNFVTNNEVLSKKYLFFLLNSHYFDAYLFPLLSASAQPNISGSQLLNMDFPFPSVAEQTRIASALTSIDNLLSSLDKLIAKKKSIKQGTMQQLLTGKKRLKGFIEPWVEKQLWEMTIWDKKFNGVPSYMQQRSIKYPYVLANVFDEMETNGGDVLLLSTGNYVGWTTIEKAGHHLCEGEVVAIPWGGVANVKYAKGKFVTADNRIATSSDLNILSNKFLYYAMFYRSEEINSFYRGASIKHPSMLDVLTMRFEIPCIAEQNAIASVLTAMDNEIAALEAKRAKYESIKQGMMQQLLTGKIRLVETAAKTNTITANVYFRRSVLAAEIADRLCEEPTFGHVKMEKILFLSERLCHIDIGSHYHRDAAGPYDNNALRSIDSQLRKQKWFEVQQTEKGYKYVAMPNRGKHKTYFDKYYSNVLPMFDKIINTFKTQRTEQCEIVATLYSAWEDLINKNQEFTDADIVNEVLNNWHESKKRISRERWHESIQWMRNNGFAPNSISI